MCIYICMYIHIYTYTHTHVYIYIYIYINMYIYIYTYYECVYYILYMYVYIYIYTLLVGGGVLIRFSFFSPMDQTQRKLMFRDCIWKTHKLLNPLLLGRHYLFNATWQMRPPLFYAYFVVSRIAILCYSVRHF